MASVVPTAVRPWPHKERRPAAYQRRECRSPFLAGDITQYADTRRFAFRTASAILRRRTMSRRRMEGQRPQPARSMRERGDLGDKSRSDHASTAPLPRSWKVWGGSAILIGAIIAAYANSFHGPFIFDDGPSIMANPSIRHLGSPQVFAAPSDSVTTTGRPILNFSFAINYAIGGLTVEGYHVVNLIIHILAALTLFGLLRRSLLLPTLRSRLASASLGLSLTISLLWAVHPLQTESVTYIVQRAESLVGLFYLLALYCYLRGATAEHGGRWYTATVLGCALGMGSK